MFRVAWMPALALAVALTFATGAGAAPLMPDLQTLDRGGLRLCQERSDQLLKSQACTGQGRTVLRAASFMANGGAGPLEYVAVPPAEDVPPDCHGDGDVDLDGDGAPDDNDVIVRQRIYEDGNADGVFQRSIDSASTNRDVGCRYFHPEHDHYHVESFARFMLQSEATGQIERLGNKISFCVIDSDPFDLTLPGAQQPSGNGAGYYDGGCGDPQSVQGVSIGWFDSYGWNLSGQEIDVTGMPPGYYCFIARADPDNLIAETDETNNDRRRRVFVDPATAPVGTYRVLTSAPGCSATPQPIRILRPDTDVTSGWRVVGAGQAWAALDDALEQPTGPDNSDYIRPPTNAQRWTTEVGFSTTSLGGVPLEGATAWVFAKTYGGGARLRLDVRWGETTQETHTLAPDTTYRWIPLSIDPPPTQAGLDDLRIRFTALDGWRTIVRAAYLELQQSP